MLRTSKMLSSDFSSKRYLFNGHRWSLAHKLNQNALKFYTYNFLVQTSLSFALLWRGREGDENHEILKQQSSLIFRSILLEEYLQAACTISAALSRISMQPTLAPTAPANKNELFTKSSAFPLLKDGLKSGKQDNMPCNEESIRRRVTLRWSFSVPTQYHIIKDASS